jgi:hypothetical protein
MRAHQLFAGAAFGPEVLKIISKAFDDAWAEVAPNVGTNPQAIEASRLYLANIIVSDNTSDADALRAAVLGEFYAGRSL